MNNKKIDIVMIGTERSWVTTRKGHRTSMLLNALKRSEMVNKILAINCPASLIKGLGKKNIFADAIQKLDKKTSMLDLPVLLPETFPFLAGLERNLLPSRIKAALDRLGFEDFALLITTPRVVDFAKAIPAKIKIFDCIDNLLFHPQMIRFHNKIKKAYEWVKNNADLICIASVKQKNMFPDANGRIYLLPNGVDDIFLGNNNLECPDELKIIKRPIAGYIGALQERVNVDLLANIARSLPQVSFVFVGVMASPKHFARLKHFSNIHFLGERKFEDMPKYINHFDVCIMPHKKDLFTDSMNPLKIYEYLACGKPVISTPVSGTEDFKGLIYQAQSPGIFSEAIKHAISDDNINLRAARKEAAIKCSWDARAFDFLKKIYEVSERKNA